MANFKYKEINSEGATVTGVLEASSKQDVIRLIRERGSRPVTIEEMASRSKDIQELSLFNKKPNLKDISIFCKQLNIMLAAGMPIINSLGVLGEQTENRRLREAIIDISGDVQKGTLFSKSLVKYSNILPALLVNMVQAGELTGQLDDVLAKLSTHYEKEYKINNKIKSAMIYPAVLATVATGVVALILIKVMPMFAGMFSSAGVELPLLTRMLMAMSDILRQYWYIVLALMGGAIFLLKRYIGTDTGKRQYDNLVFKTPKVKEYMRIITTSRFTRTLSTLLSSGIPIIQGIESASQVTNNSIVIDYMAVAVDNIKKGDTLSNVIKKSQIFPIMMSSMISIGEESGAIEEMLSKTADYYDEEFETAIAKMVALLEPLMIVIMGTIVGLIVIAIMLPMFNMATVVG